MFALTWPSPGVIVWGIFTIQAAEEVADPDAAGYELRPLPFHPRECTLTAPVDPRYASKINDELAPRGDLASLFPVSVKLRHPGLCKLAFENELLFPGRLDCGDP